VEGLDLWIPNMNDMDKVAPLLDSLQRVATRHNVCLIGSVGSPKQKGKDRYFGRDAFFGSAALARKADTMVHIEWTDVEDTNSARSYSIMPRNGRSERLYMEWRDHALQLVDKPEPKEPEYNGPPSKAHLIRLNVAAMFKPGERVVYSPEIGCGEKTFYKYMKEMAGQGFVEKREDGCYYRPRLT